MDNSSRNIVQFIASGTVVILLLMAAWYYQKSQDAPQAVNDAAAAAQASGETAPQAPAQTPTAAATKSTFSDADVQPISGDPLSLDSKCNVAPKQEAEPEPDGAPEI